MNQLDYLAHMYEADETADANSVFEEALRNDEFARMSKKEIVELKRQFLNYIRISDELNNHEEQLARGIERESRTVERLEDNDGLIFASNHPIKKSHRKYVEAFISNISVPKTLGELDEYYLDGNDAQILVEDALNSEITNWTVPRWAKRGDIVLFMHAKMARSSLTRLRTETNAEPEWITSEELKQKRLTAISDQLAFHKRYGGKIYAIGRVNGKPEIEKVPPGLHFRAKVFCDIDDLYLLEEPIDLSEFSSFIKLSSMCAVTPVFGEPYEELKSIILSKNDVPSYIKNSCSTPFPHNSVNEENWMKLGLEYRNSFSLEIQFRQCYVDYLLKSIGDQKTIYMECACYKGMNPITYVDNVIKIDKKLLPVEVKLNIALESDLEGQCEQYCNLDQLILDKKNKRNARIENVISDRILVIDTYAVYMFDSKQRSIEVIFDLDDLKTRWDIEALKQIIIRQISNADMADII